MKNAMTLLFIIIFLFGCAQKKEEIKIEKENFRKKMNLNVIDSSSKNEFLDNMNSFKSTAQESESNREEENRENSLKAVTKVTPQSFFIQENETYKRVTYKNSDIIEKSIYPLNKVMTNKNDIYYKNGLFYITGDIYSAQCRIDKDNNIETSVVENPSLTITGVDEIDGEVTYYEQKRNFIFNSKRQYNMGFHFKNIKGFAYDGKYIWIYDSKNEKQEKSFYIYENTANGLKPYTYCTLDKIDEMQGLRIKEKSELWGCSRDKFYVFDEYFKVRKQYKIDENISGFTFKPDEDTPATIVVYAVAENKNEIYKYTIKK